MFGKMLHRMVFWELLKVFALSLTAITGIVVLAGVVAEASQHNLGPAQILVVIPLLVPSLLPYTIPPTMLFATCVVYGRLAADNEILAIKAAGVNVLTVVWPALVLGLATSVATFGLYLNLIPNTVHLMRTAFLNDMEDMLYTILRKDGMIRPPGLNYAMFVQRVQGRRLEDATFKRRDPKDPLGRYDVIAHAQEAELRYDLARGVILVWMRNGQVSGEGSQTRVYFDEKVWEVPLPPLNPGKKQRAREMTWAEVLTRRAETVAEIEQKTAEIATLTARQLMTAPPSDLAQHLQNLQDHVRQKNLEIRAFDAELQMRPALAFGCFFFVLIGCPVGIWFSRSDYLSAFITCFVPIVVLYYPILLCGNNLAKDGKLDPVLGIWTANTLMAGIAVLLFRKLLRH